MDIISGIFVAVIAGLILYVLTTGREQVIRVIASVLRRTNFRLRRLLGAKDEVPESESERDRLIREHFRKSTIRLIKEKMMSVVCSVLRGHNKKSLDFSPYGSSVSFGHDECSRCGKRLS